MPNAKHPPYVTRESLLSLLTDAENAGLSSAEATRLSEGEEYLDLQHLESGVRRALATTTVTANALPATRRACRYLEEDPRAPRPANAARLIDRRALE